MQGQGQKYGQKHETKELVEFHSRLHALTMIGRPILFSSMLKLILNESKKSKHNKTHNKLNLSLFAKQAVDLFNLLIAVKNSFLKSA